MIFAPTTPIPSAASSVSDCRRWRLLTSVSPVTSVWGCLTCCAVVRTLPWGRYAFSLTTSLPVTCRCQPTSTWFTLSRCAVPAWWCSRQAWCSSPWTTCSAATVVFLPKWKAVNSPTPSSEWSTVCSSWRWKAIAMPGKRLTRWRWSTSVRRCRSNSPTSPPHQTISWWTRHSTWKSATWPANLTFAYRSAWLNRCANCWSTRRWKTPATRTKTGAKTWYVRCSTRSWNWWRTSPISRCVCHKYSNLNPVTFCRLTSQTALLPTLTAYRC